MKKSENKRLIVFQILTLPLLAYIVSAIVWVIIVFISELTSDTPVDGEALPVLLAFMAPAGAVITSVVIGAYAYFEKRILNWVYVTAVTATSLITFIAASALLELAEDNQVMAYILISTLITGMAVYLIGKQRGG
jgi:uncharacterized membrane protein YfcA